MINRIDRFIACISIAVASIICGKSLAQTQVICRTDVPEGWVSVSVNGYCTKGNSTTAISKTIRRIDGLAPGTELDICGGNIPDGWVSILVNSSYCKVLGGNSFIGRRIKKIDGLAPGTELSICGSDIPAGWVSLSVNSSYCTVIGGNSFIGRRIKKVDGLTTVNELDICGSDIPLNWVSTIVKSNYCTIIGGNSFIGRRIKYIGNKVAGDEIDICGSDIPDDWVSISVQSTYCASVGGNRFIGRRIKKVAGLPPGSEVATCGSYVPRGWVKTSIDLYPCTINGGNSYQGARIKRIEGMPIGSIVTTCDERIPDGWEAASADYVCSSSGGTFGLEYIGRKIRSLTGPPLPVKLVYLHASSAGRFNLIKWKTTQETSNESFHVERSQDGKHFTEVSEKIKGAGDSDTVVNYSFQDYSYNAGWNYYRLKQIDFDSETHYSSIVAVKNTDQITLAPNPASDYLSIKNVQSAVPYEIFDVNGRKVMSGTYLPSSQISVAGLKAGLYILLVDQSSFHFIKS